MPDTLPPNDSGVSRRRFLALGGAGVVAVAAVASGCGSGSSSSLRVNEPTRPIPPRLAGSDAPPPSDTVFDTVLHGGRVIDPETGFDQVADVGILGDRIALISTETLVAKTVIDATGLVVGPGFIDVLSYEPNSYGVWYKLGDGVTTNLGMHGIKTPVDATGFFSTYSGSATPPIHYGGAFSDQWYRDSIGIRSTASPSDITKLEENLDRSFDAGWIGVAVDPEYSPSITTAESIALGRVAQRNGMPLFTHIRYSAPEPAGKSSLDAVDEALRVARESGAAVHIDHIPSMATHVMPEAIAKIDAARGEGLDITGCFYPYTFWGTYLGSARFAGDWQSRFRISYNDLQLAGSSERLTETSFKKYQAQNKLVVAYAIPQDDVLTAVKAPWSLIGSDAIPESSNNNHPRGAGCFSRLLGPYVRDLQAISLTDALAKCTVLPAKRLEARAPMLARKGRMQMGADADITVFDPTTIADRSTVEHPATYSAGIQHVFVMGQHALTPAGVQKNITAGRPIKGQPA